jgi:GNAT superfamily N-acetyltransferase
MSIKKLLLRAGKYLQQHGLKPSIRRLWREIINQLIYNRDVLYWRDLLQGEFDGYIMPENFRVDRFDMRSEIPNRLIQSIAEHYSEKLLESQIRKAFEKGASLWCLRNDTEDIGYTWSLPAQAMKPYFFPLMERDVYFFDVFIFPSHRGRGLNSVLMNHLLKHYKSKGFYRAYLETCEWNVPEMKSLAKNGFVRIGLARRRFRHGKCKVTWYI